MFSVLAAKYTPLAESIESSKSYIDAAIQTAPSLIRQTAADMFSEQQETIIETLSGMMLNNINEVRKHVESVKAEGEKAEATLRKVFAEREAVEDRFRTKMEDQLTKLSVMEAQLREGIDQNAAIQSSMLEMGT